MKRITSILIACSMLLSFAACAQQTPSGENPVNSAGSPADSSPADSAPADSGAGTDSLPEEKPAQRLMIADAAMYRGSLVSMEESKGKTVLTLKQAEGTDYGAPEVKFLLTPDSQLSFERDQLATGVYLEVYYGLAPGQTLNPEEIQELAAANLYPEAAMVNFNGTLKSFDLDSEGKIIRLVMEDLTNGQEVVFNCDGDETQFYLDTAKLQPGDKLNIFHRGFYTMSLPPQGSALEVSMYQQPEDGADIAPVSPQNPPDAPVLEDGALLPDSASSQGDGALLPSDTASA